MCDIWRSKDRNEITAGDVTKWLPEWRKFGVQRIVLGGGEALLHSELWDICALLQDAGIGITLLSTGLLLSRDAMQLVQYCDDIVVSLDGPATVHDKIRNIPRAYERLADGVAAVKAAESSVRISGRCTVQKNNFLELRATVAAARELGLDGISFLAVDVSSEAFNRPGGWGRDRIDSVSLTHEDLPLLADELAKLQRDCASDLASGYIAEGPEKLRSRLLQYFEGLLGVSGFAPHHCNAPWVSTVIETDGTVRPCFFQPPLGNLHQADSLNSILNSPQALQWRRGLDIRRNALCRKCVCTLSLRPAQPDGLGGDGAIDVGQIGTQQR